VAGAWRRLGAGCANTADAAEESDRPTSLGRLAWCLDDLGCSRAPAIRFANDLVKIRDHKWSAIRDRQQPCSGAAIPISQAR
jgi:hypothetical protein